MKATTVRNGNGRKVKATGTRVNGKAIEVIFTVLNDTGLNLELENSNGMVYYYSTVAHTITSYLINRTLMVNASLAECPKPLAMF